MCSGGKFDHAPLIWIYEYSSPSIYFNEIQSKHPKDQHNPLSFATDKKYSKTNMSLSDCNVMHQEPPDKLFILWQFWMILSFLGKHKKDKNLCQRWT